MNSMLMTTHEDRKKLICETQQFLPTTTSTITQTTTTAAADGGALFLVWLRAGKNNSSRENICEALNNASQVWGAACCAFSREGEGTSPYGRDTLFWLALRNGCGCD